MPPNDKSRVDDLSDRLYSRTRYKDPLNARSTVRPYALREEGTEVQEGWNGPALNQMLTQERQAPTTRPFMKKFFVFAVLFFIATLLIAAFVFLGGSNFISSKNVDINVLGPTSASAGEPIELGVTVTNKNNTDLELANFYITYPEGSRDPADTGKTLTFSKDELGVMKAGDEVTRNARFVPIGATGEVKEVKFSVEYKVKGSNATFYKDKIYEITIGNAPLSLTVSSPESVTSGDVFTTSITVALNSSEILKNVVLRAEYPYGFSVVSTDPAAASEKNIWALGDFSPGTKKTVEIRGKLVGENEEERTFRFYGGVAENGNINPNIKSVIIAGQNTVKIARPALNMNISFNGDSAPVYIAPAGRAVNASVKFQNNLPEKILNPRLELSFTGTTLDKSSVISQNNGLYDQARNTLSWNLTNSSGALELFPGESGVVTFSFASMPQVSLPVANRDIGLNFTLSGTPVSGSPILSIAESRSVKIASQISLSAKALHSTGAFVNQGPIPPKVGETTSYTIVMSVGNTLNDIRGAKVTARLGTGVKWVSSQSALSESIGYDSAQNTVTWDLGDFTSGTGFSTAGREVSFQVNLVPIQSQVGTSPVLVSGITFTGTDAMTSAPLTITAPALNTRLPNDPAFIQGDDIVVKK